MDDIKELNDEDLSQVTGGSHRSNGTTYSDGTYGQLGLLYDRAFGQDSNYHPVITTIANTCSLSESGTCSSCGYWDGKGLTMYCRRRSQEVDYAKQ